MTIVRKVTMPDVRGCQVREKKKDICPHEDRTPIPSPGSLILTHAKTRRREVFQEFISALRLGLPDYLNDLNAMNESSVPFGRESYSDGGDSRPCGSKVKKAFRS